MRRRAPVSPPVALTIAGSDSGGGAGVQADLKTMEAHGVFGTSVLTAITAQNTQGVASSHVLPVDEIRAQYDAVADDFDVGAVKTGMLAVEPVIATVADLLVDYDGPVVVDPVMVAATGDRLLDPAAEAAYESLVAAATLVTPNVDEADVLTDVSVTDADSAREAGAELVAMGATAALVKGGHVAGETVVDTLVTADDVWQFEHPRVDTEATHGSGCTLSSAVAARLARGEALADAVEAGVNFIERAVRYSLDVGQGPGAVHHHVGLREAAARWETAETVASVVDAFVDRDVSALVPEVGLNVVGATPYAEAVEETAAIEGRVTRTLSGVSPNRGVRLGASSHVARFLLAAREHDPALRFAANLRFDDAVATALDVLDAPVVSFDRADQPTDVSETEGSTMGWAASKAFAASDATPAAVVDRGAVGKEAMTRLLAPDAETLRERAFAVLDALAAADE